MINILTIEKSLLFWVLFPTYGSRKFVTKIVTLRLNEWFKKLTKKINKDEKINRNVEKRANRKK